MKKRILLCLLALCLTLTGCQTAQPTAAQSEAQTGGNYSDEMKIPHEMDLSEPDGPDSIERQGDHKDSPYFSTLDFYNMKSDEALTILEKFPTQQQTTEWSCGVTCSLMVMNWYGKLGDHTEESLAEYRSNKLTPEATSLRQLIEIFEGVGGYDLYSTYDCKDNVDEVFTFDYIRETLAAGHPIMVGWNDWGGHWQVLIGYDNMGTEAPNDDVIIVADPYDTTDHNQDGYGVYGAQRFWYNFTFYDYFDETAGDLNDKCFLVAVPK